MNTKPLKSDDIELNLLQNQLPISHFDKSIRTMSEEELLLDAKQVVLHFFDSWRDKEIQFKKCTDGIITY